MDESGTIDRSFFGIIDNKTDDWKSKRLPLIGILFFKKINFKNQIGI
jgi:hypothetical protein